MLVRYGGISNVHNGFVSSKYNLYNMKSLQQYLAESLSHNPQEAWDEICNTLMGSINKISKGNKRELVNEFVDSLLMDWSERWDDEPSEKDINDFIKLVKSEFEEYIDEWDGQINFNNLSQEIIKLMKF